MITSVPVWAENMPYSEWFGFFGFANKNGTVFI